MKKYIFLDYLRVLALSMILFDHLGMYRNSEWVVGTIIEKILCKPLHIIQYFGAVGVVIFFLISGFLFANSVENNTKNRWGFFFRKLYKIYIPLILSFFTFYIFQELLSNITPKAGYWLQFSNIQWIKSATLFGYFIGEGDVINGTTWYLVPLLFFYGIGTILITKRKNKFKTGIYLMTFLLFSYVIDYFVKVPVIERIVKNSWYLTFPIIGVILYYFYYKMLNIKETVILLFFNYLLSLYGMIKFSINYYNNEPYWISVIYAIILFCAALYFKEYFKENKFILKMSQISYSIYLIHMTYGSLILSIIDKKSFYTIIFLFVCCLVVIVADIHEQFCKVVLGIERRRR